MTERELGRILSEAFRSAGLSRYVVRDQSQLFEIPEGFFVETVLSDGSKLEEAENLIASIRCEVEAQGSHLIPILRAIWTVKKVEPILRAIWTVKKVEKVGVSRGKSGGIKSAIDFRAVLESGSREADVIVEVTSPALQDLRKKVGSDDQILETVKDFLRLQLSFGGAGYWDPIRYPRQVLNEAAVLYLFAHRPVSVA